MLNSLGSLQQSQILTDCESVQKRGRNSPKSKKFPLVHLKNSLIFIPLQVSNYLELFYFGIQTVNVEVRLWLFQYIVEEPETFAQSRDLHPCGNEVGVITQLLFKHQPGSLLQVSFSGLSAARLTRRRLHAQS